MDSPQNTTHQVEEGHDESISQQSHGHHFMRCKLYSPHLQFSKEKRNQGRILCQLIGPVEKLFEEEKTAFGKEYSALSRRK